VSTVHEDEMYETSTAKSELFTLTRREETHPCSEGKETEQIECDRTGVHAFMAAAGLDAAQCCWSATFSSGPSAQDCIDEWQDARPGGFTCEGEYRRLWVFACVFHDAVTLLEHKHTELRQHEYDRGLALGTECVISVMGLEY
jgi:hypothetical protein